MEKRSQSPESGASGSPLDWAELVALLGSVGGTIATFAGQSAAFAVGPATVALLLNRVNRQRMDQLSLQNTRAARVQVQQVSEQLQGLQQRLSGSTVGSQGGEQFDLQPLQANVGYLQQQYDGLHSALSSVTERLQSVPSTGEIAGLENTLADLSARLSSVEQAPGTAVAVGESVDLAPLRASIESLETRLAQVSSAPAEPGIDSGALEHLKTEVHSQYTGLAETLSSLSARLVSLEQAPEAAAPAGEPADLGQLRSDLETLVTPVRQQVESLEARMSNLAEAPAPGVEPAALEGLQTQVHQLNSQVESALTEMSQKVADVPVTVHSILQEQLQHQPVVDHSSSVEALKQQVELLEKRLEEVASQSSASHNSEEDDLDLDALLSGLE
jgi:hypothetical protein